MNNNMSMSPSERMMTGDLILVRGNRFPTSNLIRFITGTPYTHVGIAFDESTVFEVDAFEKLNKRAMQYDDYVIIRLKTTLNNKQKSILKQHMRQMEADSKGYDWLMIVSILVQRAFKIPLRLEDPHRFICSEVVDQLYLQMGIDLLVKRDQFISPDEFLSSDLLEIVFDTRTHKN